MKLLIADDEPLVRRSIKSMLRELDPDLILLEATNGASLSEMIRAGSIDVALVDIKMPGLSGLEAIRSVKSQALTTSFYVLTGFAEFEYARQALQLGVLDYFVKPVERKSLASLLTKEKERHKAKAEGIGRHLSYLLSEAIAGRELADQAQDGFYQALAFTTDPRLDKSLAFAQEGCAEALGEDGSFACAATPEAAFAIIHVRESDTLEAISLKIARRDLAPDQSIFFAPFTEKPASLAADIKALKKLLLARPLLGLGKIHRLDEPALARMEDGSVFNEKALLWEKAFDSHNYVDFQVLSSEIACALFPASEKDEEGKRDELTRFVYQVLGQRTPVEPSQTELMALLEAAAREMLDATESTSKMQRIADYIRKHYSEGLSISSLGELFGLSPNYLSVLFKAQMGEKITNYLTRVRLTHAKRLIATTKDPIKEIAELSGYHSQSYFVKIFQKSEGTTPLLYRQAREAREGKPEQAEGDASTGPE